MYEYRRLSPSARELLVRRRMARGYPKHDPPHPFRDERTYLITAACYEHRPVLATNARRRQFELRLLSAMADRSIVVVAWVVLPNHYHVLLSVEEFSHISSTLRLLHGSLSHQWNQEDEVHGRRVWYRFADRAIRSERHLLAAINYIHYNPCKHMLVTSPYDWPTSSVHEYESDLGRDWLRQNWLEHSPRAMGAGWDDH